MIVGVCFSYWGFKYGKVFKLEKKIARILSLSKYNAHTEPIFKKIKLLKIRDILNAYNMIYINPLVNMFSEKTVFALTYP